MKKKEYISKELFEIIERYIKGDMTLKESQDINQLIELDDEFKNNVEEVKAFISKTEEKKEELNNLVNNVETQPAKKNNYNFNHVRFKQLALATAFIIGFGSIYFFSFPENEKLYTKYYTPAQSLPNQNKKSDDIEFFNAMDKYNRGEYNAAIKSLQKLALKNPANDTLNYFIGVAHLANKNTDSAIPFLERTVQSKKTFPLISEANYYLGLAYLKEGKTKLAKQFLNESETENSKKLISKLSN